MNKKIYTPDYILSLEPYKPGKPIEELEREYGISGSSKIASNENPIGPSPQAVKAIEKALGSLHRYPDGGCYNLTAKIAEFNNVNKENIVVGNGSDDVIGMITKAFLVNGDEAIMTDPSFLMYEIMVVTQGATPVFVPLKPSEELFAIDLNGVLRKITEKTRIIFITNPNNPTGAIINKNDFKDFLGKIPDNILIVIDEAYIEFADDENCFQSVPYLNGKNPIAILRTFSKIYGLAGLRIGYGIMPENLISVINRIRQPFNVNSLAQVAAVAALDDQDFVNKTKNIVKTQLARMKKGLEELGYKCFPTNANFFLVDVGCEADIMFERLLKEGVIVRSMRSYGYPRYLRITAGNEHDSKKFLAAMKKLSVEVAPIITIDGPAGAGKTTVSKLLARELGYKYVDTGALYRGIAFEADKKKINIDNNEELSTFCANVDLDFKYTNDELRLFSSGKDISDKIRTPKISMLASDISAKPIVRETLLQTQKKLGEKGKAVFEGRDMGTVVFPEADIKFYLDASTEKRAERRFKELQLKGDKNITLENVLADVKKRDKNDMSRSIAPLKPAENAVLVDATELNISEVIAFMLNEIKKM